MSLKKIKIIDVIGLFGISFLLHFLYKWLPNPLFAWTMPVNESIWEHMKIFLTAIVIWSAVDHYLLKKNNILYNNFAFQIFVTSLSSILIYLLLYLPIRNLIGESMVLSISLMFIVYVISQLISYKILTIDDLGIPYYIVILLITIMYGVFIFLTYKPIRNYIFYDKTEGKYGINTK